MNDSEKDHYTPHVTCPRCGHNAVLLQPFQIDSIVACDHCGVKGPLIGKEDLAVDDTQSGEIYSIAVTSHAGMRGLADNVRNSFDLYVEPGDAPAELIQDLLTELSALSVKQGGSPLVVIDEDVREFDMSEEVCQ